MFDTWFILLGGPQYCNHTGSEIRSGHSNLSPISKQPTSVWFELSRQERCRNLCYGNDDYSRCLKDKRMRIIFPKTTKEKKPHTFNYFLFVLL